MTRLRRFLLSCVLVSISSQSLCADDWPQWLGLKRDSVWRETGIIEKFPVQGPPVLWRQPVAGGYAGPAVADGRVFVADFLTEVDTRQASVPDKRAVAEGQERIHCFDCQSGERIWMHSDPCTYNHSYPAGPRCTPTVHQGKVYSLGAEGNLLCLDAAKGKLLWSKDFKRDFQSQTPHWGFCGHPLIEGQNLICVVSGKEGLVYAFDKDTGKEVWHALSAVEPGFSSPTMIDAGGVRQLLVWHPESLNSLNPATGSVYWTFPFVTDFTMSIMTPRQSGDVLFIGGNLGKSVLLKLTADRPGVKEVWRGTTKTGAAPVNSTPFLEDGFMYAIDKTGPLLGVRLDTGERVWKTYRPVTGKDQSRPVDYGTAFLVKNGNRFFLTGETGHLIIAKLNPKGYEEISRWKMLEPTGPVSTRDDRVLWSHPAFANKCVYARNDKELICVNLAAEPEMRTLVVKGDLIVDETITYTDTHLKVMGNVNLLRNGSLILDGCIVEIVGEYARQYAYNWRGGTLTTRDTTIGGTMRNGVAQQANFNLDDGLWTAADTTVQYTYGIQFSHETVGRLRATRLRQGPNPDSIVMAGKGDVELTDSTYMIALNLQMRGDKGTLDLPNDVPITRTINGSNMPGATFRLKLTNVTVPDFWFIFFNDVSMTGKPTDITLKNCKKFLPSIMGTDLAGEVTLSKGLEQPLRIGNLTIRREGTTPVNAFAMGLYLSGKENNLVLLGPIVICELMMFNGGQVTFKGTQNTYDAACSATTLDLHGSSKVELINARLGRPFQYGPISKVDNPASVIGQVTVGDQAQLMGRNVSLGRLRLITRDKGTMRFGPYATTDTIDKTQDGGNIEFGTEFKNQ